MTMLNKFILLRSEGCPKIYFTFKGHDSLDKPRHFLKLFYNLRFEIIFFYFFSKIQMVRVQVQNKQQTGMVAPWKTTTVTIQTRVLTKTNLQNIPQVKICFLKFTRNQNSRCGGILIQNRN